MTAGFERDVSRCSTCSGPGCFERNRFRMRATGAFMPAFGNHTLAVRDDAAGAWIGIGRPETTSGQLECLGHVPCVLSCARF